MGENLGQLEDGFASPVVLGHRLNLSLTEPPNLFASHDVRLFRHLQVPIIVSLAYSDQLVYRVCQGWNYVS